MPYAFAIGAISGSTTTIAEKMSITVPTISRITLIASRKTIFESTCSCVHATSFVGTSALTMKSVSAVDAKMMMKIAPIIAIASWLTAHSVRAVTVRNTRASRITDVEHRERGDLRQAEAGGEPEDHAERDEQLGQRLPEALRELGEAEPLARQALHDRDGDRYDRQHADQDEAGDHAGEQEALGVPVLGIEVGQAVDRAVDEQRQRGREQEAHRAGAGDEAHREPLGVAVADERRHQHAAERDDRHAGGAGEHGEQRAGADRDDREARRAASRAARWRTAPGGRRSAPRRAGSPRR